LGITAVSWQDVTTSHERKCVLETLGLTDPDVLIAQVPSDCPLASSSDPELKTESTQKDLCYRDLHGLLEVTLVSANLPFLKTMGTAAAAVSCRYKSTCGMVLRALNRSEPMAKIEASETDPGKKETKVAHYEIDYQQLTIDSVQIHSAVYSSLGNPDKKMDVTPKIEALTPGARNILPGGLNELAGVDVDPGHEKVLVMEYSLVKNKVPVRFSAVIRETSPEPFSLSSFVVV
jgi:hypothetical protein